MIDGLSKYLTEKNIETENGVEKVNLFSYPHYALSSDFNPENNAMLPFFLAKEKAGIDYGIDEEKIQMSVDATLLNSLQEEWDPIRDEKRREYQAETERMKAYQVPDNMSQQMKDRFAQARNEEIKKRTQNEEEWVAEKTGQYYDKLSNDLTKLDKEKATELTMDFLYEQYDQKAERDNYNRLYGSLRGVYDLSNDPGYQKSLRPMRSFGLKGEIEQADYYLDKNGDRQRMTGHATDKSNLSIADRSILALLQVKSTAETSMLFIPGGKFILGANKVFSELFNVDTSNDKLMRKFYDEGVLELDPVTGMYHEKSYDEIVNFTNVYNSTSGIRDHRSFFAGLGEGALNTTLTLGAITPTLQNIISEGVLQENPDSKFFQNLYNDSNAALLANTVGTFAPATDEKGVFSTWGSFGDALGSLIVQLALARGSGVLGSAAGKGVSVGAKYWGAKAVTKGARYVVQGSPLSLYAATMTDREAKAAGYTAEERGRMFASIYTMTLLTENMGLNIAYRGVPKGLFSAGARKSTQAIFKEMDDVIKASQKYNGPLRKTYLTSKLRNFAGRYATSTGGVMTASMLEEGLEEGIQGFLEDSFKAIADYSRLHSSSRDLSKPEIDGFYPDWNPSAGESAFNATRRKIYQEANENKWYIDEALLGAIGGGGMVLFSAATNVQALRASREQTDGFKKTAINMLLQGRKDELIKLVNHAASTSQYTDKVDRYGNPIKTGDNQTTSQKQELVNSMLENIELWEKEINDRIKTEDGQFIYDKEDPFIVEGISLRTDLNKLEEEKLSLESNEEQTKESKARLKEIESEIASINSRLDYLFTPEKDVDGSDMKHSKAYNDHKKNLIVALEKTKKDADQKYIDKLNKRVESGEVLTKKEQSLVDGTRDVDGFDRGTMEYVRTYNNLYNVHKQLAGISNLLTNEIKLKKKEALADSDNAVSSFNNSIKELDSIVKKITDSGKLNKADINKVLSDLSNSIKTINEASEGFDASGSFSALKKAIDAIAEVDVDSRKDSLIQHEINQEKIEDPDYDESTFDSKSLLSNALSRSKQEMYSKLGMDYVTKDNHPELEKLEKAVNDAAEKHGYDSDEYKSAEKAYDQAEAKLEEEGAFDKLAEDGFNLKKESELPGLRDVLFGDVESIINELASLDGDYDSLENGRAKLEKLQSFLMHQNKDFGYSASLDIAALYKQEADKGLKDSLNGSELLLEKEEADALKSELEKYTEEAKKYVGVLADVVVSANETDVVSAYINSEMKRKHIWTLMQIEAFNKGLKQAMINETDEETGSVMFDEFMKALNSLDVFDFSKVAEKQADETYRIKNTAGNNVELQQEVNSNEKILEYIEDTISKYSDQVISEDVISSVMDNFIPIKEKSFDFWRRGNRDNFGQSLEQMVDMIVKTNKGLSEDTGTSNSDIKKQGWAGVSGVEIVATDSITGKENADVLALRYILSYMSTLSSSEIDNNRLHNIVSDIYETHQEDAWFYAMTREQEQLLKFLLANHLSDSRVQKTAMAWMRKYSEPYAHGVLEQLMDLNASYVKGAYGTGKTTVATPMFIMAMQRLNSVVDEAHQVNSIKILCHNDELETSFKDMMEPIQDFYNIDVSYVHTSNAKSVLGVQGKDNDLIVWDEAGLIPTNEIISILEVFRKNKNAKGKVPTTILMGDKSQMIDKSDPNKPHESYVSQVLFASVPLTKSFSNNLEILDRFAKAIARGEQLPNYSFELDPKTGMYKGVRVSNSTNDVVSNFKERLKEANGKPFESKPVIVFASNEQTHISEFLNEDGSVKSEYKGLVYTLTPNVMESNPKIPSIQGLRKDEVFLAFDPAMISDYSTSSVYFNSTDSAAAAYTGITRSSSFVDFVGDAQRDTGKATGLTPALNNPLNTKDEIENQNALISSIDNDISRFSNVEGKDTSKKKESKEKTNDKVKKENVKAKEEVSDEDKVKLFNEKFNVSEGSVISLVSQSVEVAIFEDGIWKTMGGDVFNVVELLKIIKNNAGNFRIDHTDGTITIHTKPAEQKSNPIFHKLSDNKLHRTEDGKLWKLTGYIQDGDNKIYQYELVDGSEIITSDNENFKVVKTFNKSEDTTDLGNDKTPKGVVLSSLVDSYNTDSIAFLHANGLIHSDALSDMDEEQKEQVRRLHYLIMEKASNDGFDAVLKFYESVELDSFEDGIISEDNVGAIVFQITRQKIQGIARKNGIKLQITDSLLDSLRTLPLQKVQTSPGISMTNSEFNSAMKNIEGLNSAIRTINGNVLNNDSISKNNANANIALLKLYYDAIRSNESKPFSFNDSLLGIHMPKNDGSLGLSEYIEKAKQMGLRVKIEMTSGGGFVVKTDNNNKLNTTEVYLNNHRLSKMSKEDRNAFNKLIDNEIATLENTKDASEFFTVLQNSFLYDIIKGNQKALFSENNKSLSTIANLLFLDNESKLIKVDYKQSSGIVNTAKKRLKADKKAWSTIANLIKAETGNDLYFPIKKNNEGKVGIDSRFMPLSGLTVNTDNFRVPGGFVNLSNVEFESNRESEIKVKTEKKRKAPKRRKDAVQSKKIKKINKDRFNKTLERILGSDIEFLTFEERENLFNNSDAIYGMLSDKKMEVYSDQDGNVKYTTPRHEVFHWILNHVLSSERRTEVMNQARDVMIQEGKYSDRLVSEITDEQADEWLAEKYTNLYSGKEYSGIKGLLQRLFNFIRQLSFRINKNRRLLDNLFRNIEKGTYASKEAMYDHLNGTTRYDSEEDISNEDSDYFESAIEDSGLDINPYENFGGMAQMNKYAREMIYLLRDESVYGEGEYDFGDSIYDFYVTRRKEAKKKVFQEIKTANGTRVEISPDYRKFESALVNNVDRMSDEDYELYFDYIMAKDEIFVPLMKFAIPQINPTNFKVSIKGFDSMRSEKSRTRAHDESNSAMMDMFISTIPYKIFDSESDSSEWNETDGFVAVEDFRKVMMKAQDILRKKYSGLQITRMRGDRLTNEYLKALKDLTNVVSLSTEERNIAMSIYDEFQDLNNRIEDIEKNSRGIYNLRSNYYEMVSLRDRILMTYANSFKRNSANIRITSTNDDTDGNRFDLVLEHDSFSKKIEFESKDSVIDTMFNNQDINFDIESLLDDDITIDYSSDGGITIYKKVGNISIPILESIKSDNAMREFDFHFINIEQNQDTIISVFQALGFTREVGKSLFQEVLSSKSETDKYKILTERSKNNPFLKYEKESIVNSMKLDDTVNTKTQSLFAGALIGTLVSADYFIKLREESSKDINEGKSLEEIAESLRAEAGYKNAYGISQQLLSGKNFDLSMDLGFDSNEFNVEFLSPATFNKVFRVIGEINSHMKGIAGEVFNYDFTGKRFLKHNTNNNLTSRFNNGIFDNPNDDAFDQSEKESIFYNSEGDALNYFLKASLLNRLIPLESIEGDNGRAINKPEAYDYAKFLIETFENSFKKKGEAGSSKVLLPVLNLADRMDMYLAEIVYKDSPSARIDHVNSRAEYMYNAHKKSIEAWKELIEENKLLLPGKYNFTNLPSLKDTQYSKKVRESFNGFVAANIQKFGKKVFTDMVRKSNLIENADYKIIDGLIYPSNDLQYSHEHAFTARTHRILNEIFDSKNEFNEIEQLRLIESLFHSKIKRDITSIEKTSGYKWNKKFLQDEWKSGQVSKSMGLESVKNPKMKSILESMGLKNYYEVNPTYARFFHITNVIGGDFNDLAFGHNGVFESSNDRTVRSKTRTTPDHAPSSMHEMTLGDKFGAIFMDDLNTTHNINGKDISVAEDDGSSYVSMFGYELMKNSFGRENRPMGDGVVKPIYNEYDPVRNLPAGLKFASIPITQELYEKSAKMMRLEHIFMESWTNRAMERGIEFDALELFKKHYDSNISMDEVAFNMITEINEKYDRLDVRAIMESVVLLMAPTNAIKYGRRNINPLNINSINGSAVTTDLNTIDLGIVNNLSEDVDAHRERLQAFNQAFDIVGAVDPALQKEMANLRERAFQKGLEKYRKELNEIKVPDSIKEESDKEVYRVKEFLRKVTLRGLKNMSGDILYIDLITNPHVDIQDPRMVAKIKQSFRSYITGTVLRTKFDGIRATEAPSVIVEMYEYRGRLYTMDQLNKYFGIEKSIFESKKDIYTVDRKVEESDSEEAINENGLVTEEIKPLVLNPMSYTDNGELLPSDVAMAFINKKEFHLRDDEDINDYLISTMTGSIVFMDTAEQASSELLKVIELYQDENKKLPKEVFDNYPLLRHLNAIGEDYTKENIERVYNAFDKALDNFAVRIPTGKMGQITKTRTRMFLSQSSNAILSPAGNHIFNDADYDGDQLSVYSYHLNKFGERINNDSLEGIHNKMIDVVNKALEEGKAETNISSDVSYISGYKSKESSLSKDYVYNGFSESLLNWKQAKASTSAVGIMANTVSVINALYHAIDILPNSWKILKTGNRENQSQLLSYVGDWLQVVLDNMKKNTLGNFQISEDSVNLISAIILNYVSKENKFNPQEVTRIVWDFYNDNITGNIVQDIYNTVSYYKRVDSFNSKNPIEVMLDKFKQINSDISQYKKNEFGIPLKGAQQSNITVKEGVPELFESNPELANEVYEALGFDINTLSYAERAKKYKEFGIKKSDGTEITEQDIEQDPTFYQNNTNQSDEDYIASEKTIRDLAERTADRIGLKVRYESDRTKDYKGKLEGDTIVINLAYATLDTPIHEILGHPIIRALKTGTTQNKQLYQNLLKELEYGKGKEVLDRIKRDYITKEDGSKYTLEEQQEEAIVELLGLYTADRLDKVKDEKSISLLKRLLKEMKAYLKSLFNAKEVKIDELPDNMTLGDIADLLAYRDSKLILPGNEVIYTTPDNQTFKTYQEASNHISELVKLDEVDLSKPLGFKKAENIKDVPKLFYNQAGSRIELIDNNWIIFRNNIPKAVPDENIIIKWYNEIGDVALKQFIEKNKEYEQSKEIVEEWKKVNDIKYDPEEVYSRGQGFYSVVGAYSDFDVELMFQNLLAHIEDNKKAGGEFTISAFTKPVDEEIEHLEGGGGKIKFKIFPKSNDIKWAANTDVYSGSVWDASEKFSKDNKFEIIGVSYTKSPSLKNINSVQPNLAGIIDNLAHHHNELGIELTSNNFRLEYDDNVPYSTKKLINKINSILDSKFGELVEPDFNKYKQHYIWDVVNFDKDVIRSFKDSKEAISFIEDSKNIKKYGYLDLVEREVTGEYNKIIPVKKVIEPINKFRDIIYNEKRVNSLKDKIKYYEHDNYILQYKQNIALSESIINKVNQAKNSEELNNIYFNNQYKSYTSIFASDIVLSLNIIPIENKKGLTANIYIESIKGNTINYRTYYKKGDSVVVKESNLSYELNKDNVDKLKNFAISKSENVIQLNKDRIKNRELEIKDEIRELNKKIEEELKYKKDYSSQAEINTKIAALKKGQRKFPRSLIRSEVRPYKSTNQKQDLSFQLVRKKELTPKQQLEERIKKQQAQQLYSQYLDTIFPDSEVKDILYHGTRSGGKFNSFDINHVAKYDSGWFGKGFYFTKYQRIAQTYSEMPLREGEIANRYVHKVIINLKNPQLVNFDLKDSNIKKVFAKKYQDFSKDGAISYKVEDGVNNFDTPYTEYRVNTQEQIHILGSKQDIEGFKEFVQGNSGSTVTLNKSNNNSQRFTTSEINFINDKIKTHGDNIEKFKKELGVEKMTLSDLNFIYAKLKDDEFNADDIEKFAEERGINIDGKEFIDKISKANVFKEIQEFNKYKEMIWKHNQQTEFKKIHDYIIQAESLRRLSRFISTRNKIKSKDFEYTSFRNELSLYLGTDIANYVENKDIEVSLKEHLDYFKEHSNKYRNAKSKEEADQMILAETEIYNSLNTLKGIQTSGFNSVQSQLMPYVDKYMLGKDVEVLFEDSKLFEQVRNTLLQELNQGSWLNANQLNSVNDFFNNLIISKFFSNLSGSDRTSFNIIPFRVDESGKLRAPLNSESLNLKSAYRINIDMGYDQYKDALAESANFILNILMDNSISENDIVSYYSKVFNNEAEGRAYYEYNIKPFIENLRDNEYVKRKFTDQIKIRSDKGKRRIGLDMLEGNTTASLRDAFSNVENNVSDFFVFYSLLASRFNTGKNSISQLIPSTYFEGQQGLTRAIKDVNKDLSSYYTESEINDMIQFIASNPNAVRQIKYDGKTFNKLMGMNALPKYMNEATKKASFTFKESYTLDNSGNKLSLNSLTNTGIYNPEFQNTSVGSEIIRFLNAEQVRDIINGKSITHNFLQPVGYKSGNYIIPGGQVVNLKVDKNKRSVVVSKTSNAAGRKIKKTAIAKFEFERGSALDPHNVDVTMPNGVNGTIYSIVSTNQNKDYSIEELYWMAYSQNPKHFLDEFARLKNDNDAYTPNSVFTSQEKGMRKYLPGINSVKQTIENGNAVNEIGRIKLETQQAQAMSDALKEIFPGVPIIQETDVTSDAIHGSIKSAWIDGEGVHLNIDSLTPDSMIHEFVHLFNRYIKENNPDVYGTMVNEMEALVNSGDILAVSLYDSLQAKYNDSDLILEEMLASYAGIVNTENILQLMAEMNIIESAEANAIANAVLNSVSNKSSRLASNIRSHWNKNKRLGNSGFDFNNLNVTMRTFYSSFANVPESVIEGNIDPMRVLNGAPDGWLLFSNTVVDDIAIDSSESVMKLLRNGLDQYFRGEDSQSDEDMTNYIFNNEAQIDKNDSSRLVVRYAGKNYYYKYDNSSESIKKIKDKIRSEIVPKKRRFEKEYSSNMKEFLLDIVQGETNISASLVKHFGTSFKPPVHAINELLETLSINKSTEDIYQYSELKDSYDPELRKLYDERFIGNDPLVIVHNTHGERSISIFDFTSQSLARRPKLLRNRNLGGVLSNNRNFEYNGGTWTNSNSHIRALGIGMLVNHIYKSDSNISIAGMGVGNLSYNGFDNVIMPDTSILNKNIKALSKIKGFTDLISDESIKEIFENPVDNQDFALNVLRNYVNNPNDRTAIGMSLAFKQQNISKENTIKALERYMKTLKANFPKSYSTHQGFRLASEYYLQLKSQDKDITKKYRDLNPAEARVTTNYNLGSPIMQFIKKVNDSANAVIRNRLFKKQENIVELTKKIIQHEKLKNPAFGLKSSIFDDSSKFFENMYIKTMAKDPNTGKMVEVITRELHFDKNDPRTAELLRKKVLTENHLKLAQEVMAQMKSLWIDQMVRDRNANNDEGEKYTREQAEREYDSTMGDGNIAPIMDKSVFELMFSLKKKSIKKAFSKMTENISNDAKLFTDIQVSSLSEELKSSTVVNPFSNQLDSSVANEMLGLKVVGTKIQNGKKINEYEILDITKNRSTSTNIFNNFTYFALSSIRKPILEENVLPVIDAGKSILKFHNADNTHQYLENWTRRNIEKINNDSKGDWNILGKTKISTIARGAMKAMTFTVLGYKLSIGLKSYGFNSIQQLLLSSSYSAQNALRKKVESKLGDETLFTARAYGEAVVLLQGGLNSAGEVIPGVDTTIKKYFNIARELGVIFHSERDILESLFLNPTKRHLMQADSAQMMNIATDAYARIVTMIAVMKTEGSFGAYDYNFKTGEVTYDETKDRRFYAKNGKKKTENGEHVVLETIKENVLKEEFRYNIGHDSKLISNIRRASDKYVIGSMTDDVKALLGNHWAGALLSQFKFFAFDRLMNAGIFGYARDTKTGAGYKAVKDEDGNWISVEDVIRIQGGWQTWISFFRVLSKNNDMTIRKWWDQTGVNGRTIFIRSLMRSAFLMLSLMAVRGWKDDDRRKWYSVSWAIEDLIDASVLFDVYENPIPLFMWVNNFWQTALSNDPEFKDFINYMPFGIKNVETIDNAVELFRDRQIDYDDNFFED